jgi:hypothetical protein
MDPAPDPALFVSDLQDTIKKKFFSSSFLLLSFEDTFTVHHSLKIKSYNEVANR